MFRSKKELEIYIKEKNLSINIDDFNFTKKKDNSKNLSFVNLNKSLTEESISSIFLVKIIVEYNDS